MEKLSRFLIWLLWLSNFSLPAQAGNDEVEVSAICDVQNVKTWCTLGIQIDYLKVKATATGIVQDAYCNVLTTVNNPTLQGFKITSPKFPAPLILTEYVLPGGPNEPELSPTGRLEYQYYKQGYVVSSLSFRSDYGC